MLGIVSRIESTDVDMVSITRVIDRGYLMQMLPLDGAWDIRLPMLFDGAQAKPCEYRHTPRSRAKLLLRRSYSSLLVEHVWWPS